MNKQQVKQNLYTDALIAKADAEAKAKAEATKKQTEASKPASQPSKPSNNTPSTPSKPARTDKDYYGVALAIWNGNYVIIMELTKYILFLKLKLMQSV